ncbi:MAG: nitroreductase [Bacteroidetes bacterium]|nr:nitroreductase [Bacteroidota bacterium]
MVKKAVTENPVHELIRSRWSARSFSDKPIAQADLDTIFEAASWAFSAMNAQPWEYVYAHRSDTEAFEKLWNCLMPGNQPWAKNAAVLVVSLVKKKFENGNLNAAALHDVGAANAQLSLQATALGIHTHPMGGFDKKAVIELMNLDPTEVEPVLIFALGYLDAAEKLEEPFQSRELTGRSRNPVEEFAEQL